MNEENEKEDDESRDYPDATKSSKNVDFSSLQVPKKSIIRYLLDLDWAILF